MQNIHKSFLFAEPSFNVSGNKKHTLNENIVRGFVFFSGIYERVRHRYTVSAA